MVRAGKTKPQMQIETQKHAKHEIDVLLTVSIDAAECARSLANGFFIRPDEQDAPWRQLARAIAALRDARVSCQERL